METDSKRYDFAVGLDGVVAFDQLDPGDRVSHWAQGPALSTARLAFNPHAAADQQLTDETTGASAWG
ncbi:hypothetical protein [Citricoccus muralis]|uniref:Uncharacterized protein n=1 Tax=Citricoccus muralis TaxID=169134 RepID=A0A3D9L9Y6_9MICC|nr:hypothetical protein [Citricoccus muralis]REE02267.1 hypothetical protein C8E99_0030 [Citricoccus muralis]